MKELSYKSNLGVLELVDFYGVASDNQKGHLQGLIDSKKWKEAWALIQKVTKTKLVGMGEDQYIDPTKADVDAILNPDTDDSFEMTKRWGGGIGPT
ncbi:hypothetical protein LCGC14_2696660 [marine sediment metagenome]|uniref:Uncharacterized protein n=1 Tax=marine sediment metagenome TaxID=412755 RepID=A0A0F9A4H0_9ZZZZ